ncbi:MAG TPA: hypothetical protein VLX91_08465 [Candidatus Acidoferrales bacterium]|nr:hypothetical protein [Candidatus Acidoferrales bacterium]
MKLELNLQMYHYHDTAADGGDRGQLLDRVERHIDFPLAQWKVALCNRYGDRQAST